jgi:hypothetical protein
MFSESTGRIIVEVSPYQKKDFEGIMGDDARCVGSFLKNPIFSVYGLDGQRVVNGKMEELAGAWKSTHGDR